MSIRTRDSIVLYLRSLADGDLSRVADAGLLLRFAKRHDATAFDELLRRHGPMLWNVCLRQAYDRLVAEDVFQATCLVLARKAGDITRPEQLAAWLHGVAVRIARREYAKRPRATDPSDAPAAAAAEPNAQLEVRELFQLLDAELANIPEKLRSPLILCYLEGKTRDQAAAELGLSLGTLKRRLEEGRENLRERLLRRGVALPAALLALASAELAVPARLLAGRVLTDPAPHWAVLAAGELARPAHVFRAAAAVVGFAALVAGFAVANAGPGVPILAPVPPAKPVDIAGDPLPDGAVARLGVPRFRLPGGERTLAVAADGKTIAVGHADGVVCLDARSGKELRRFPLAAGRARPVALSADGRFVAAVDRAAVVVWDAKSGKEATRITEAGRRPPGLEAVALSADGTILAVGDASGRVRLVPVADAAAGTELLGHAGPVRRLRFSADGKMLASGGTDRTVRVWGTATGKELRCFDGRSPDGSAAAFDPDGGRLAIAGPKVANFTVVDLATGKTLFEHTTRGRAGRAGFTDVAFSPDGKHPLAGTTGGGLWVWTADGKLVRESRLGPNGRIGDIALAGNLAVAATDVALHAWDPVSGRETAESSATHGRTHARQVTGLRFSPDGRVIVSTDLNTVRVWDPKSGEMQLQSSSAFGTLAGFSPDGKTYVQVRPTDGAVWRRELATGKLVEETALAPPNAVPLAGFALSPTADRLAVIDANGVVRLSDLPAGKAIADWDLPPDPDRGHGLAFSADGKSLAFAGKDGEVRIAAAADGTARARVADAGGAVNGLAFAGGPKKIVVSTVGADDGRSAVALWDAAADERLLGYGDPVRPDPRPGRAVRHPQRVTVSPDGRFVATAGDGTGVRLWDRGSGKLVRTFEGHTYPVVCLNFSPCGQFLATAATDGIGLVWRVNPTRGRQD